jgi:hypothetical protein
VIDRDAALRHHLLELAIADAYLPYHRGGHRLTNVRYR